MFLRIDLFAEDRAHEQLLPGLIERLADEGGHEARLRIVSARGGHPRVAKELETYQKYLETTGGIPNLLIVGIDANCQGFQKAKKQYEDRLSDQLQAITVIAAPDPHIERWYMIDGVRFEQGGWHSTKATQKHNAIARSTNFNSRKLFGMLATCPPCGVLSLARTLPEFSTSITQRRRTVLSATL